MRQAAILAPSARSSKAVRASARRATDDPMRPARGIAFGLGLGALLWSALGALFLL